MTGLYKFAVSRGRDRSPLPATLPKLPPQQTPYVYSTEELGCCWKRHRSCGLGTASSAGNVPHAPLTAVWKRDAYWRGTSLDLAGRRSAEQVITVRDTKFFKTRLVPVGPKLTRELVAHIERRRLLPLPKGNASPLFTTRDGRQWRYTASSHGFSMSAGPQESIAPLANLDLPGCMTFVTRRQCIGWSHGIAPARTFSDYSRNSRPTLVTSISDQPNAIYR